MADQVPDGMRPTYYVFHKWLASKRRDIAAGRDQTVIYSGMDNGRVPEWRKLAQYADELYAHTGRHPNWQSIEHVLSRMPCELHRHQGGVELPDGLSRFKSMWDFGCGVESKHFVTKHESQQIWKNLSAWYVKNAVGEVYIWKGDVLKRYPDMLLAEIPVLMKNKKISPAAMKRVQELVPDSKALWERFRDDTPKSRTAGR